MSLFSTKPADMLWDVPVSSILTWALHAARGLEHLHQHGLVSDDSICMCEQEDSC